MAEPWCPTPEKSTFRDGIAARAALARIRHKSNRDRAPVRAYRCPAGHWHLTSKPQQRPRPDRTP